MIIWIASAVCIPLIAEIKGRSPTFWFFYALALIHIVMASERPERALPMEPVSRVQSEIGSDNNEAGSP